MIVHLSTRIHNCPAIPVHCTIPNLSTLRFGFYLLHPNILTLLEIVIDHLPYLVTVTQPTCRGSTTKAKEAIRLASPPSKWRIQNSLFLLHYVRKRDPETGIVIAELSTTKPIAEWTTSFLSGPVTDAIFAYTNSTIYPKPDSGALINYLDVQVEGQSTWILTKDFAIIIATSQ